MPSRGGDRDEPRPPEDPRTIHSIKTRMNTKNAVANMAVGIKMVELQLRKAGSAPRRRWLKKIRMVIVLAVISMTMWDFIPRERSISEDFGPRRRPQSYGSALFKELFRFSYDQFLRVHSNTGWDPWLHIGKKDHRMWLQSDWVLMCLLRRLAAPARLVDICMQVGGARSTVDDAFLWAVDYFFDQWGDQLSDIGRWKDRFDKFAAHTRGAGCMHHGVIGYVDGNDQFVCRPGGDGCITRVPFQASCYSRKKKRHAILWMAVVLVNGLVLIWGPYPGRHHDASVIGHSGLLEVLSDLSEELGFTVGVLADAAYPLHECCYPAIKSPAGGGLTQHQRRYNLLLSQFRIGVEDVFANMGQQFAFLQHVQNQKLGKSPLAKIYAVSTILFNFLSILNGNEAWSMYREEEDEDPVTLEEYMDV